MPTVHVHLVRHGESTWNRERRLQGQVVHPGLTSLGREQAQAAAETLAEIFLSEPGSTRPGSTQSGATQRGWPRPGTTHLWSSDLVRAAQTAAVIGRRLRLPVRHDEALREQGLGRLEGRLTRDLRSEPTPPGEHIGEVRWGGGESTADVHTRVGRFLARELMARMTATLTATGTQTPFARPHAHSSDGTRHLVLVSHGDTIRVARAWLLGRTHRDLDWDHDLPNGSVTTVTARPYTVVTGA